jgi:hypothetical protein
VCSESSLGTVLKAAKNCPKLRQIIIVDGKFKGTQSRNGIELISFAELLKAQPTIVKTNPEVDLKRDVVILPYSSGTTGNSVAMQVFYLELEKALFGSFFKKPNFSLCWLLKKGQILVSFRFC